MDEARKRVIAMLAGMFLCRRLPAVLAKSSPQRETAFREAFELAEEIVRRVDKRWPRNPGIDVPAQRMNSYPPRQ